MSNIKPALVQRRRANYANLKYLHSHACILPCKGKRQYLLTLQVSRYCRLPLHGSIIRALYLARINAVNPLTAGVAYIWVFIFISTLSTTF